MEGLIAVIDENGQLALPAEARIALGVSLGGEVELVLGNDTVELKKKREPISDAEFNRRLADMRALFSRKPGEPSLEDDLYAMRREEEEHARRKYGC